MGVMQEVIYKQMLSYCVTLQIKIFVNELKEKLRVQPKQTDDWLEN